MRLQCNWLKLLQMQSMFLTQQQANNNTTSNNNGCYIYNTSGMFSFQEGKGLQLVNGRVCNWLMVKSSD